MQISYDGLFANNLQKFLCKTLQSVSLCHRLSKKLNFIKIWQLKVGQNKDLVCYRKKYRFRQCAWELMQLYKSPVLDLKGGHWVFCQNNFNSLRQTNTFLVMTPLPPNRNRIKMTVNVISCDLTYISDKQLYPFNFCLNKIDEIIPFFTSKNWLFSIAVSLLKWLVRETLEKSVRFKHFSSQKLRYLSLLFIRKSLEGFNVVKQTGWLVFFVFISNDFFSCLVFARMFLVNFGDFE